LHLLLQFKEIFIPKKEQQLLVEEALATKVKYQIKEMHSVLSVMKSKLLFLLTCLRFKRILRELKQIGETANKFANLFQQ